MIPDQIDFNYAVGYFCADSRGYVDSVVSAATHLLTTFRVFQLESEVNHYTLRRAKAKGPFLQLISKRLEQPT